MLSSTSLVSSPLDTVLHLKHTLHLINHLHRPTKPSSLPSSLAAFLLPRSTPLALSPPSQQQRHEGARRSQLRSLGSSEREDDWFRTLLDWTTRRKDAQWTGLQRREVSFGDYGHVRLQPPLLLVSTCYRSTLVGGGASELTSGSVDDHNSGALGSTKSSAECPGYEESDRTTVCVEDMRKSLRRPTCGLGTFPSLPLTCLIHSQRSKTRLNVLIPDSSAQSSLLHQHQSLVLLDTQE